MSRPISRRARRCGRPAAAAPCGFTLIELLVSLVLLGLVMTLVYGAFGQISGPALALRDQLTEQQELRLLTRMIADDLQAAQWLDRFWSKGVQFHTGIVADTRLEGSKEFTRISLHTARPARFHRGLDPLQDPGLHEVGYSVETGEGDSQLVLVRREDFYLDDDLEDGGVTVELANHITEFRVQFLPIDADPNAIETPWEDRWDAPSRPENSHMPVAIRLTVGRTDPAGRMLSESIEFNLPASLKL
ncbi:MAG TPA: prepilin-type N-terminal cleavage/methylation domain-containing protein [bacterium]